MGLFQVVLPSTTFQSNTDYLLLTPIFRFQTFIMVPYILILPSTWFHHPYIPSASHSPYLGLWKGHRLWEGRRTYPNTALVTYPCNLGELILHPEGVQTMLPQNTPFWMWMTLSLRQSRPRRPRKSLFSSPLTAKKTKV